MTQHLTGRQLLVLLACASPKTGTVMRLFGDYPSVVAELCSMGLIYGQGVEFKLTDRGECLYAGLLATNLPVLVTKPQWEIPK